MKPGGSHRIWWVSSTTVTPSYPPPPCSEMGPEALDREIYEELGIRLDFSKIYLTDVTKNDIILTIVGYIIAFKYPVISIIYIFILPHQTYSKIPGR